MKPSEVDKETIARQFLIIQIERLVTAAAKGTLEDVHRYHNDVYLGISEYGNACRRSLDETK